MAKYIKKEKNSSLTLGAMITVLALSKDWKPGTNEKKVLPRILPFGNRLLRTPLHPEGKSVPITILRDPNANEDEGYDPKAPTETLHEIDDGVEVEPIPDPELPAQPDVDAPAQPEPQPEARPGPRARSRKNRGRPGIELPSLPISQPNRIARIAFDGPSRSEFEEMKREMRANHRLVMEGQAAMRFDFRRFVEESRTWQAGDRETKEILLERHGYVLDPDHDERAMKEAHDLGVARVHIPREP
ncbi:hypothetical protein CASFOL_009337 [Castilleja foliolosa]|uniref:SHSP domain-containing protein n=1 Tax=Castilleja foliolosa TaxID=1961234 RepID=A0ABD3DWZ3_9LAMI